MIAPKANHREYGSLFRKGPIEMLGGVPGDAKCTCGGIAYWHGPDNYGCDDCQCDRFELACDSCNGPVTDLEDPPRAHPILCWDCRMAALEDEVGARRSSRERDENG